jgi:site-specific DNA recombinase
MNAKNKNSDIIPNMQAILFCRVSSREQEEAGYSLPSQQKLLTEYALRKNFSVSKTFLVSESASGKNQRQAFNEMLSFIKKEKIKIIICEKTDRFTRNLKDAVILYEWLDEDEERQLHLVKDNLVLHKNSRSQEKLNLDFRIVFSKNYIDNLSEEVKKGQKEKLEQGWFPGKPKLGYKNIDVNGHKIHVIDETKAPFIRKAFQLYATGTYSIKRLSESLYEEGFRTNQDDKVGSSLLHRILSHPYYVGINRWNGKEYPARNEPLISKELFYKVQNNLKNKTTAKYRKHFYLFRGLPRCGECGGTITWEIQKGTVYGHCTLYKPCSQNKWIREPDLEKQILFSLKLLRIKNKRVMEWIKKALHQSNQDVLAYHNSILDDLNNRFKAVEKRLSNLYDDKADGTISKEFYLQKKAEYTKEQKEIEETIELHNKAGHKFRELGLKLYEVSQRAEELYLEKSPEKKRSLLGLIFKKLIVKDTKLTYEYTIAFKMLARLAKITNSRSKVVKKSEKETRTFELEEKPVNSIPMSNFAFLHPEVRRERDSNP